ncbi:unnamed protein product, partial [Phaeothamnion confervicola]
FTPSNSGQRSLPTSYRGCWHVVSRSFLSGYRPFSSPLTGVYNPKTFFLHAASLRQGFPHCAIFLTAASRRSLDRVSVPPLPYQLADRTQTAPPAPERAHYLRVTHPSATRYCYLVRLACVRHAASVSPEPGSNSPSNCIA